MQGTSQPKKYYANPFTLLFYIVLCGALSAIPIAVLLVQDGEMTMVLKLMMVFCLIFSGGGGLLLLWMFIRFILRKPTLVLSQDGIINATSMVSYKGLIPWSELVQIKEFNMEIKSRSRYGRTTTRENLLSIGIKDPVQFAQRLTPLQRYFFEQNRRLSGGNYIHLGLRFIHADPQDVIDAVVAYSKGAVMVASTGPEHLTVNASANTLLSMMAGNTLEAEHSHPEGRGNQKDGTV